MYPTIEAYLDALKTAMSGADTALIQDAQADAYEHLSMALEAKQAENPDLSVLDALTAIIEGYGTPEETASAYREIEPGVLQSREDPSTQLAFATLSDGKTYVSTPQPFSFVKAKWYESLIFHRLLLVSSILILIITLFKWLGAFVKVIFKRESQPLLAHLARLSGVVFGLLLLTFLIAFVVVFADMEPVYQIPRFVFELPSALPFVLAVPPLMAVVGVVLAVFVTITWIKKFWNLRGRLGYTFVTLCAWVMLGELMYWNFL